MDSPLFELSNVHIASPEGVEIVRGVDLVINKGEVHALLGPIGCGKSPLASAVAGSPEYVITEGTVKLNGDDVASWEPDVRARAGLFVAFHQPQIPGVSMRSFLHQAVQACTGNDVPTMQFYQSLSEWMETLGLETTCMDRIVNEGLTDGERMRHEILQMAILEPDVAILGLGLDTDTQKILADGVQTVRSKKPEIGVLAITENLRVLDHLKPDRVHLMDDGKILSSGGIELIASTASGQSDELIGAST